ncbi:peptidoglycan recognition protein family protein [Streptococcus pluranimalium]|uniref:Bifunctional autolysin n=1 Tax=Streptococcus pluranimalium TaxID=82348 RepID=A0A345VL76_9STRE|nr:peptidoglycan recognition family protein [Streptococcus pluranimalium]AXJ13478.1 Bifunctional autolysin [Streptococcus pluranimalium]
MASYKRRRKTPKTFKTTIIIISSLMVLMLFAFGFIKYVNAKKLLNYETQQMASIDHRHELFDEQWHRITSPMSHQETITITSYREKKVRGSVHLFAGFIFNGKQYYTLANQLTLIQDNPINQAVADLGYPQDNISKQINKRFAKIPYFNTSRQPKGIVIHETGNDDSTLDNEISYMIKNYHTSGVFVHSFINANQIITIANPDFMAQGAGPKANPNYIQFEMTRENSPDGFTNQIANAAYYTAKQLHHYHLPVTIGQEDGQGSIWTHDMVSRYLGGTDHSDPVEYWRGMANYYWGVDYTVEDFTQLVQAYYNQL